MREYIWLPEAEIAPTAASRSAVDRPIAVVDGVNTATPATYYVHTDHLHRPIRMTNAAKAIVWSAEYQPWGAVQSLSGPLTMDLRFPGQWFQLEAGLHYNWHRHYDASLGRYTQPDPLGFVDGPSVYGYAGGSPHRWTDPSGLLYIPLPQTRPPGGSNAVQCGWKSNVCRWVLRWLPSATVPTAIGKWVLVWSCGNLDDASNITIVDQDGDTTLFSMRLKDGGEIEVIANVKIENNTLTLDQLHIHGPGPGSSSVRELREFARELGRQNSVDTVIINGGTRTTGANPGHIPRTIIIPVN